MSTILATHNVEHALVQLIVVVIVLLIAGFVINLVRGLFTR